MSKLLILSRYDRMGASSRYRLMQYIPYFEENGFECTFSPFFDDNYLINRYSNSNWKLSTVGYFFRRFKILLKIKKYDLIFVEKEVFPFFPAWAELIIKKQGVPYVVDYDDAIFHRYDLHRISLLRKLLGGKLKSVIKNADIVTVGNQYLSDYSEKVGAKHIEILPTVVDLDYYDTVEVNKSDVFTIVWIGSPTTARYVEQISNALASVCENDNARLIMIGAKIDLPGVPVEFVEWSEETEVQNLKSADVGIMPLSDEPWERGKCGFKLIQYMASRLPVIASPVGINCEIVEEGVNGYLVSDTNAWVSALNSLRANKEIRIKMGLKGREKVGQSYCLKVVAPILTNVLKNVLDSNVHSNIDHKVVEGFGLEWEKFDQSSLQSSDLKNVWEGYFTIFPWQIISKENSVGIDVGCGSGRWAGFVAERVKHLYAIDPSNRALSVAKENLKDFDNITFHKADVEKMPLDNNSLDFAYSLGVLHHIPETAKAIRSIAEKLKSGAPFLVYLYYSFDNKPRWFRALWRWTDFIRRVISKLPFNYRYASSQAIAFLIYWPFARTGLILSKLGIMPSSWPLSYYKDKPIYFMRNDSLDRFGTILEQRFTREEVRLLLEGNGFKNVVISDEAPYWCACGIKE